MELNGNSRTRLAAAGVIAGIVLAVALGVGFPAADASAQVARVAKGAPAATFESVAPAAKITVAAATPVIKVATKQRTPVKTASVSASSSGGGTTATKASKTAAYVASTSELSSARSILAGLVAKYPIPQGTSVSFGDAKGYQAISYYKSGRIVISASHTASLSRILNHEVWHIIDWRDNGRIDWGENVPPSN
ncbi:MAG: hypothetical protein ACYC52_09995 [Coriobacteriia bacterium]